MNERAKITASHLARQAIVYLRQSSPAQVEHNRESTQRQYALANRARELGWSDEQIVVIDEDLGLSGAGSVARAGFARLTTEVALGRVVLVLGLEVSRVARNNADGTRPDQTRGADRHTDRRCRRHLSAGAVQRRFSAWSQGNDERSRVARAAGPPQRRYSQ